MKKLFTTILSFSLLMMAFTMNAQSPRMVLVEEATQASCPPCATANPPLQALLNMNSDKAIFIGYQVWWPGVDAMYEDNTTEVQSRIGDYYSSITGAPNIVVQGSSGGQAVSYLTQTLIDDTYAEMSEFDMDVTAEVLNGELVVGGTITATADVSGDLRLRLIITEDVIYNGDLAFIGTNGETEFHHVFKKFANGPEGITLEASWVAGDSYTINETYDLSALNIYNYSGLEVVALVQNDDNKFIHQAAKAHDLSITVDAAFDAGVVDVGSLPETVCSGIQSVAPSFDLVNNGNEDLTAATIMYNVNGGAMETYDWTGTLTTFQKEEVTLPAISFQAEASNIVAVEVTAADDSNADNNQTASSEFVLAPTSGIFITVELNTDTYADETYWEVRNSSEEVIASGGNPNVGTTNIGLGVFPPPADPAAYANSTQYLIQVDILELDCYTFHITDYFGDGMSYGGSYRVLDNLGNVMVDSGNSPSFTEILSPYEGDMVNRIEEVALENSIKVFPNPVSGLANINFNLIAQADANLVVMNALGQQVIAKDLGTLATGQYSESIDMADLSAGLYYVQLNLNDETITKRITVSK